MRKQAVLSLLFVLFVFVGFGYSFIPFKVFYDFIGDGTIPIANLGEYPLYFKITNPSLAGAGITNACFTVAGCDKNNVDILVNKESSNFEIFPNVGDKISLMKPLSGLFYLELSQKVISIKLRVLGDEKIKIITHNLDKKEITEKLSDKWYYYPVDFGDKGELGPYILAKSASKGYPMCGKDIHSFSGISEFKKVSEFGVSLIKEDCTNKSVFLKDKKYYCCKNYTETDPQNCTEITLIKVSDIKETEKVDLTGNFWQDLSAVKTLTGIKIIEFEILFNLKEELCNSYKPDGYVVKDIEYQNKKTVLENYEKKIDALESESNATDITTLWGIDLDIENGQPKFGLGNNIVDLTGPWGNVFFDGQSIDYNLSAQMPSCYNEYIYNHGFFASKHMDIYPQNNINLKCTYRREVVNIILIGE